MRFMTMSVGALALVMTCGCQKPDNAPSSESADPTATASANTEKLDFDEQAAEKTSQTPSPVELEPLPEPEGEDGQFSISQVMELAHENKLYKQLMKDSFPPEVGQRLITLYTALPTQSSPEGDDEDWQTRSVALRDSAQMIVDGNPDGVAALRRAVNCSSCHSRHKP